MLFTLPLWLIVAKAQNLYDADEAKTWHLTSDEVPRLFYWATISTAIVWLTMSVSDVQDLSPGVAAASWGVVFVSAGVLRTLARWMWRLLVPPERGVVIGSGRLASVFTRKLQLERGHHLSIEGCVTSFDGSTGSPAQHADLVRAAVAAHAAHRVIVAMDDLNDETLGHIIAACRSEGVKLSVAPPSTPLLGNGAVLHHVAEIPLIEVSTVTTTFIQSILKRTIDVVVSAILLLLSAPLLAAVAAAVRLDSPGSAIFRQQRAGRGGEPFTMFKCRSMCNDAEARLRDVVNLDELEQPMFKVKGDPRVTRVGAFLRRTSIDELPQLWNVLRGHMSLVGPRPEEMLVVERYPPAVRAIRLAVKPGLTGPMQVHGRGELTFDERLSVEQNYVNHYSLRADMRILARTAAAVVFRGGAF